MGSGFLSQAQVMLSVHLSIAIIIAYGHYFQASSILVGCQTAMKHAYALWQPGTGSSQSVECPKYNFLIICGGAACTTP